MSPDLTDNLIHTLYLTFAHNYLLFAYLAGLIISLAIAIHKPSRFALLLVLGFAILAFSFEYDKHIAEGLRAQTLASLITGEGHYRARKLIDLVIGELLPMFFYISGWGFIYLAIFLGGWHKRD